MPQPWMHAGKKTVWDVAGIRVMSPQAKECEGSQHGQQPARGMVAGGWLQALGGTRPLPHRFWVPGLQNHKIKAFPGLYAPSVC